jgi:hypothetical protein
MKTIITAIAICCAIASLIGCVSAIQGNTTANANLTAGANSIENFNNQVEKSMIEAQNAKVAAAQVNLATKIGSSKEREQAASQAAFDSHQSNACSRQINVGR